jgi:hypothetical protein
MKATYSGEKAHEHAECGVLAQTHPWFPFMLICTYIDNLYSHMYV